MGYYLYISAFKNKLCLIFFSYTTEKCFICTQNTPNKLDLCKSQAIFVPVKESRFPFSQKILRTVEWNGRKALALSDTVLSSNFAFHYYYGHCLRRRKKGRNITTFEKSTIA